MSRLLLRSAILCTAVTLAFQPARATSWTTYTSATGGSVTGSLTLGAETVTVGYSGEISFTQLNGTGTDFYKPAATYVGGPTTSDMIAISGNTAAHTFTFSSALVNPEIAIVSLGQPGDAVGYNFDAPFTIVSQGAGIPYGGCSTCLSVSGDTLTGTEGDGILQFTGTFSSLSFTVTGAEYWNGFTVGADSVAGQPIGASPEPGTIGLMGIALVGLGVSVRRFRK